jgi:TP901 family phage tail tape measure protein
MARRTEIAVIVSGLADLRSLNTSLNTYEKHVASIITLNERWATSGRPIATTLEHTARAQGLVNTALRDQNTLVSQAAKGAKGQQDAIGGLTQATDRHHSSLLKMAIQYRAISLVFNNAVRAINDTKQAIIDLDYQSARVRRVVPGNVMPSPSGSITLGAVQSGKDVKEIAEGYYQLGTWVKRADDLMSDMNETMKLVVGTESDMKETAQTTMALYNQFGHQMDKNAGHAENYRRLIELQAIQFRNSNVEVNELIQSVKYLGPIAESARVPVEQLFAVLGGLEAGGQRGRMAGTSSGQFISQLISRNIPGTDDLKVGERIYKDVIGRTPDGGLDLVNTLERIISLAHRLPKAEMTAFMREVSGTQNAFRFLGVLEETLPRIKVQLEANKDAMAGLTHEADRLKAIMSDTWTVQTSRAWNGFITSIAGGISELDSKTLHIKGLLRDIGNAYENAAQMAEYTRQRSESLRTDTPRTQVGAAVTNFDRLLRHVEEQGKGTVFGAIAPELYSGINVGRIRNMQPDKMLPFSDFETDQMLSFLRAAGLKGDVAQPEDIRRAKALAEAAMGQLNKQRGSVTPPGPAARTGRYGGVESHVERAGRMIEEQFGVKDIGGYRATARDKKGHPAGLALDAMVGKDRLKGKEIAEWAIANREQLGVSYVIWDQHINSGSGWRKMADRGSDTENHKDHPHIQFHPMSGLGRVGRLGQWTLTPGAVKEQQNEARRKREEAARAKQQQAAELRSRASLVEEEARAANRPIVGGDRAKIESLLRQADALSVQASGVLGSPASRSELRSNRQLRAIDEYNRRLGVDTLQSGASLHGTYSGIYEDQGAGPLAAMHAFVQEGLLTAAARKGGDKEALARLLAGGGPYSSMMRKGAMERAAQGDKDGRAVIGGGYRILSMLSGWNNRLPGVIREDMDRNIHGIDRYGFPEPLALHYRQRELESGITRLEGAPPTNERRDELRRAKEELADIVAELAKIGKLNAAATLQGIREAAADSVDESLRQYGLTERPVSRYGSHRYGQQRLLGEMGILDAGSLKMWAAGDMEGARRLRDRAEELQHRYGYNAQAYEMGKREQAVGWVTSGASDLYRQQPIGSVLRRMGDAAIESGLEEQIAKMFDPWVMSTDANTEATRDLTAAMETLPADLAAVISGEAPPSGQGGGRGKVKGKGSKALTYAKYGLAAYSVLDNSLNQPLTAGSVLSGAIAGFGVGGPVGAAIGGGLALLGGLFGGKKKAKEEPKDLNPAFYNTPNDLEYAAYRYRATGQLPDLAGMHLFKTNAPVVNVYVDGVKKAVRTEIAGQTQSGRVAMVNTRIDLHQPL